MCGMQLSLTCPACQYRNMPGARFCGNCGRQLVDVAGEPAAPEGQSQAESPFQPGAFTGQRGEPGTQYLSAFELGSPGGAGFRFLAYILDTMVIVFPAMIMWVMLGNPLPENWDQVMNQPEGYDRLQIMVFFLTMAYHTGLITYLGTTAGKRLFGLYVVRTNGSRVGFVRALGRFIISAVSANLLLGIPFLVILFRSDRRGVHDLICGTVVIRRYRQG